MNIKYVYVYTKNIFNIKVDYTCHFYWVTSKLDYFYPKKYYIGIKKKTLCENQTTNTLFASLKI